MRAGHIAGIQLKLNLWFIILIILFVFAGFGDKILLIVTAVLFHEFGHAFMAHSLGYQVLEIELLPFGGVARIDQLNNARPRNEIMIAAAGPFVSMVLAAAAYYAYHQALWAEFHEVVWYYVSTNLMLACFNLIPALPLDGGRILRAYLSPYLGYRQASRMVVKTGYIVIVALLSIIVYEYLCSYCVNLTMLSAAFFLYVTAKAETKGASFQTMRVLAGKKAQLSERGLMPAVHFTAVRTTIVQDIIRFFEPEQYYMILIVDDQFQLQGLVTESDIWDRLPEKGLYAKIGDFLE